MTLSTLRTSTALVALMALLPNARAQFLNNTTWAVSDEELGLFAYLHFSATMLSVSEDNVNFSEVSTYTENGNTVTITDLPDVGCPTDEVGVYTYDLDLPNITWTVVDDACADRMLTLTGFVWELQGFTGIAGTDLATTLSVYPNPVQDEVRFTTSSALTGTPYTLHDVAGSMVATGRVAATATVVPVESLPAGTYFLHIGTGNLRAKVIKIG